MEPHGLAPSGVVAPDRGAASLLVAAVGLFLVCAGVVGAAVIGAEAAVRRVRIAADLGALAGAPFVPRGESMACERATRVVAANGARTASCDAEGLILTIRAALDAEPWPGLHATIHAEARAGPATAPAEPDDLPAPPASVTDTPHPQLIPAVGHRHPAVGHRRPRRRSPAPRRRSPEPRRR
ncbi:Rv3654c family TadE-like protein [Catenuloplanes sp. NPDC020197]